MLLHNTPINDRAFLLQERIHKLQENVVGILDHISQVNGLHTDYIALDDFPHTLYYNDYPDDGTVRESPFCFSNARDAGGPPVQGGRDEACCSHC